MRIKEILMGKPNEFDMEQRMVLGIIYCAIVAYCLGLISMIFRNNGTISIVLSVYVFIMSGQIYFARVKKIFKFPFIGIIISLIPIYFLWFSNGGTFGGTPFLFLAPIIPGSLLLKKNKRYIILIIIIVSLLVMTCIEYMYPDFIKRHETMESRFTDLVVTYTLSCFAIFYITEVIIKEYNYQRERADQLLFNMLPKKIAEELMHNGKSRPTIFKNVSVLFSDFENFTSISSNITPEELIRELSDIFSNFDIIVERNNCQRIKTIGDAYLCVSGMPEDDEKHAVNMVKCAIEMLNYLEERNKKNRLQWKARVGINSGEVVAGIVGIRKYIYDIFGDAVNIASRMEENSESMSINVSENTYNLTAKMWEYKKNKIVDVKGKGMMNMYLLKK